MELSKRLKVLRKEAGLSQEGLARRADISLNVMNRIETGAVTDPHFSTLVGISGALGLTVGELLGEKEAPKAPASFSEADEERRARILDQVYEAALQQRQADKQTSNRAKAAAPLMQVANVQAFNETFSQLAEFDKGTLAELVWDSQMRKVLEQELEQAQAKASLAQETEKSGSRTAT